MRRSSAGVDVKGMRLLSALLVLGALLLGGRALGAEPVSTSPSQGEDVEVTSVGYQLNELNPSRVASISLTVSAPVGALEARIGRHTATCSQRSGLEWRCRIGAPVVDIAHLEVTFP